MSDLKTISKGKFIFFIVILFVFLLSIGFSVTYNVIDPDFGWHLKTGQLILERGVPKTDWYSYTMPNFPWIDHEWLTDVAIYKMFSHFGSAGTLVLFLSIFILAFLVLIKREAFIYFLPAILLGYLASFDFLSIRPQMLTVFFIAILSIILSKISEGKISKWVYLCPVLFLIWANLHGGFAIGLLLIFLYLAVEVGKKTKLFQRIKSLKWFVGYNIQEPSNKKIIIYSVLFFSSIIFTFINPYGPRLYVEIFRTFGDNFARSHISEWMPLFSTSPFLYSIFEIFYIGAFLGLLIIYYKKIDFTKLSISLIFLALAFLAQRNFLIFVIFTIPILAQFFAMLNAEIGHKYKFLLEKQTIFITFFIIFELLMLGLFPFFISNFKAQENFSYPVKAVNFLKTRPLSENLFNEYNWGGYLIWKLPERKVFIDGRMPCWQLGNQDIFKDYIKMANNQPGALELFKKYNIGIALLQKERENLALKYINYQGKKHPENWLSNFVNSHKWMCQVFGVCTPEKNIYNELITSGWHKVFEDDQAVILEK